MNVATAILIFSLAVLFGRWHRRLRLQQLSIIVATLAVAAIAAWAVATRNHSPEAIAAVTSIAFGGVVILTFLSFAARRWIPPAR